MHAAQHNALAGASLPACLPLYVSTQVAAHNCTTPHAHPTTQADPHRPTNMELFPQPTLVLVSVGKVAGALPMPLVVLPLACGQQGRRQQYLCFAQPAGQAAAAWMRAGCNHAPPLPGQRGNICLTQSKAKQLGAGEGGWHHCSPTFVLATIGVQAAPLAVAFAVRKLACSTVWRRPGLTAVGASAWRHAAGKLAPASVPSAASKLQQHR